MSAWKDYRIKDIASYIGSGTTPSSKVERYYNSEDYHWINTGDFNDNDVYGGKQMISSAAISEIPTLRFYPENTILVAMYGASIGKVGVLKVDATVNQACCAIIPNRHLVLPYFLFYAFVNQKDTLLCKSFGGTQPNVSQRIISNLLFRFPSLDDQQRIVDYLDAKLSEIDKRLSILEKQQDAYSRLKKSIIHQAVTRGLNPDVHFKDSDIEWIGMTPKHWEIKRFKELAKTIKGKQCDYFDSQGDNMTIVLTLETLRQDVPSFYNYGVIENSKQLCKKGDIVIIWDGAGVGEFLKAKEGLLSSTIAKIEVDSNKILKDYLWHWRYQIEYRLKSVPTGMGIPHLNPNLLNNFILPIPPLSEQEEIAKYLDEKSAKIDAAIENIEKQIEASKRLKKAIINEAISGKINL